jgi:hypothetical protein
MGVRTVLCALQVDDKAAQKAALSLLPSVDAHHSTENGEDKTVIVTNGENRHTRVWRVCVPSSDRRAT